MKQHGLHQQVPVIRINVGMERSRNLSLHTGTKVYHYYQGQNKIIFCLKLPPSSLKYAQVINFISKKKLIGYFYFLTNFFITGSYTSSLYNNKEKFPPSLLGLETC